MPHESDQSFSYRIVLPSHSFSRPPTSTIDVSQAAIRRPQATLDLSGGNPAVDVIAVNNALL